MKVFVVRRTNRISWCEDYEMTVVAPDKLTAIKTAQYNSIDFKNASMNDINVAEVKLDEVRVLTVDNTGAAPGF